MNRRERQNTARKEILAICEKYGVVLRGWDDETVFIEDKGKYRDDSPLECEDGNEE